MGTSGNRDWFWASRSVLMLLECFWGSVRVELGHIYKVGQKKYEINNAHSSEARLSHHHRSLQPSY